MTDKRLCGSTSSPQLKAGHWTCPIASIYDCLITWPTVNVCGSWGVAPFHRGTFQPLPLLTLDCQDVTELPAILWSACHCNKTCVATSTRSCCWCLRPWKSNEMPTLSRTQTWCPLSHIQTHFPCQSPAAVRWRLCCCGMTVKTTRWFHISLSNRPRLPTWLPLYPRTFNCMQIFRRAWRNGCACVPATYVLLMRCVLCAL